MPIHLRENQYQGVNAHLHSYLQQHDEWQMFHDSHIDDLREALQELLPLESGYLVANERSLQISHYDPSEDKVTRSRSKPDISIYQSQGTTHVTPLDGASSPTAILPVFSTVHEPEYFLSIAIYRVKGDALFGELVTRIELLSPANKPPGSHSQQYLTKRDETLAGGIRLVELDYLHERSSPVGVLPDYPKREQDAYPYKVLVSNPKPSIHEGKAHLYGFRVDDPMPVVSIPLDGSDRVNLDLGAIYNHTFSSNNIYGMVLVDYEKPPENLDAYDKEDQQRIQKRMASIVHTHKGKK